MPAESQVSSPRIVAKFRRQVWVHDYAVDVDGDYEFDVTDMLLSWPKERVREITDHSYEADAVWQEHPVSMERPWDGPYEVEVVASINAFLAVAGAGYTWGDIPTNLLSV